MHRLIRQLHRSWATTARAVPGHLAWSKCLPGDAQYEVLNLFTTEIELLHDLRRAIEKSIEPARSLHSSDAVAAQICLLIEKGGPFGGV